MGHYVYKLTNIANGMVYIGKTNNPKRRLIEHVSESKRSRKNHRLYNAIQKYGVKKFKFSVLGTYESEGAAFEAEIELIREYRATEHGFGYNCTMGGEGVRELTPERRKVLSEIARRRFPKGPFFGRRHSEATKLYMSKVMSRQSGENHPMWGKARSESTKRAISEKKGKLTEVQVRALRSDHTSGVKLSKLAASLGISYETALDAVRCVTYKWVT